MLDSDVRVSRHLEAPPEAVYDAWLDPVGSGKWLFATPTGNIVRAEVDPRVGGQFIYVDQRPEGEIEHVGTYTVLERPGHIAFDFNVTGSSQPTHVDIEIRPAPQGSEIVLVQEGVPGEHLNRTLLGWQNILARLESNLVRPAAFVPII